MDSGSGSKSQEARELFTITTDVMGRRPGLVLPDRSLTPLGESEGRGSHESESRTLLFRNEQPVFQFGRIVVLI